jgi:hypothetical protein
MGDHTPNDADGAQLETTLDGRSLARTATDAAGVSMPETAFEAFSGLDAHLERTHDTVTVGNRICAELTGETTDKSWAAAHRAAGSVNALLTDTELVESVGASLAADDHVAAVRTETEGVQAVAAVAGTSLKGFQGEDALAERFGWDHGSMEEEDQKIDMHAGAYTVQVKVNEGTDKKWGQYYLKEDTTDYLVVIDGETGGVGVSKVGNEDVSGYADNPENLPAYKKAEMAGE